MNFCFRIPVLTHDNLNGSLSYDESKLLVSEPENRMMILMGKSAFSQFWNSFYQRGLPSASFLRQEFAFHFLHPIEMFSYDPWFAEFNAILGQMLDHGIVDDVFQRKYPQKSAEEIPALVLTMDHLAVGFIACFIPLMLSVILFFFELSRSTRSSLKKALVGLVLLKSFYQVKFEGLRNGMPTKPVLQERKKNFSDVHEQSVLISGTNN